MDRRQMILGSVVGAFGVPLRADAAQKTIGGPQPERVAEAERAFAATMEKRDLKGFASHIAEEAIFMGGSEPPRVLRGRAAIVEGWTQYFVDPVPPFSWEPDIVEVLDSGSMAFTSGPVLDPSRQLVARFNSIWRLESDGRWRVLVDRGAPICPCL
jgi:ketosteroid isomerase-like protein